MTGTDIYYTHIKTKYISGLVVSSGSVKDGAGSAVMNDVYLTITDNAGNTYYFPGYDTKV